jgi:hypothetical protein
VAPIPARQHHSAQTNQDAARFSTVDAGCRSRSPTASADAACSSPRCKGARTVVSGLGGDEMVAVGPAESEQAAVDKTEGKVSLGGCVDGCLA